MKNNGMKDLLNPKSMLMYPGIVLAAGWTFLNIVRMINYHT